MSSRDSRLFWSELNTYETCPQQCLWTYGWEDLDVGGGPGRPKPKPKKSEHHSIMGQVIQKVLERAYNEGWFYRPQFVDYMKEQTRAILLWYLNKSYVPEDQMSFEQMAEVCVFGVLGYLHTMRQHKLWGRVVQCERRLEAQIGSLQIGGKPDFIFKDEMVRILDGKNSQSKDAFVNPDQLRWYALCYQKVEDVLPDQLGFVWYRYPFDAQTKELGIDWIPVTARDLEHLSERAVRVRLMQIERKFDPIPIPKNCRICNYESVCEARKSTKKGQPKPITTWFANLSHLCEFDLSDGPET